MKKVLFVCTQNRLRSPTAENVFSNYRGIQAKSAGLDPHAKVHLTSEMVDWADIIFVMENIHLDKIRKKYSGKLRGKKLICLNIPDEYDFMQSQLIEILKDRVSKHLKALK
ncbi:phosphotyrosine protein phosphatase [Ignavibacterium sp.]|uniref:low molecular weight protein tyrosine phosphatase family protein n=1 Tax=Ignavibacterium sp. TaxID=2651167 RepID=UPI0022097953|nr:phosphotyrosine protein phosphatase [Ignavibacterium sp.]BDQ03371.1 MAG: protein-tyrosine-phosphatase [Ignavibacterium sp.]